MRSRRAQRSGVAGWLWQNKGHTFCMRTYGFGPRQSSHTMGKSLRSHPSASGSRSRRCAIGNGEQQLGATSRAAMQESSVLGKDACSGRSAPQKARNRRQTAMTRSPLFGPSPVLFPRPVETRALCCRYARLAPPGRARTHGSCARVGLLRLGGCQSARQPPYSCLFSAHAAPQQASCWRPELSLLRLAAGWPAGASGALGRTAVCSSRWRPVRCLDPATLPPRSLAPPMRRWQYDAPWRCARPPAPPLRLRCACSALVRLALY